MAFIELFPPKKHSICSYLMETVINLLNGPINYCLKDLDNWFKSNKLTLNLDKTSYMVFSPRRIFSIKLLLNDVEIEKAHTCKYLGIYLDDQLNWKNHIDYICKKKLAKICRNFYRLRSKIVCEWLRNIYYSFVYYTELRCMPIRVLLI